MSIGKKVSFFKKIKRLSDKYPRNLRRMVFRDYRKLYETKGLTEDEYWDFEFERQNDDFRRSFLGLNEQRYYLDFLNPKKYYIVSRNKYVAHRMLERVGVRFAELYAYYSPEGYAPADQEMARDCKTLVGILKRKGVDACVIKSTEGSHGDGVSVVRHIEYGEEDCEFTLYNGEHKNLSSLLENDPLIFEQVVEQTAQMSSFNPSSVNTVRFMTTLLPSGEAKVIATWFKLGRKGSCVDNAGSGGNVDGCVDIGTGEMKNAVQFDGWRHVSPIEKHPDSGVQINGTVINNWEEAKSEIVRFQQAFPFCKAAGWDVAFTDRGPVVIEVNDMWDSTGQLFIRHGWRKEIRECYLQWKKMGSDYIMSRDRNALSNERLERIVSNE